MKETMELYKRMPPSIYKDVNYLCSNCNCEYEEIYNTAACKMKMRNYKRHCPSCHYPSEKRRLSLSDRLRTLGNVEAMLNRYERVFTEPINPTIKKSQSSPLSQKVCWHDYQMNTRPYCLKRLPQMRRQRRNEQDRCLLGMFRMKEVVKSELANEDFEICPRYIQSIPIKPKKHNRCKNPEESPGNQRYFNTDSVILMNYIQHIPQLKKPYASNLESRHHCVSSEYITETKIESNVDQRNEPECEEMKKPDLIFEDEGKQKGYKASIFSENNEKNERRIFDVGKTTKLKMPSDNSYSNLAEKSVDKPVRKIKPDGSAHLAKLDLHSTKNHILESIDQMLGTMGDMKVF